MPAGPVDTQVDPPASETAREAPEEREEAGGVPARDAECQGSCNRGPAALAHGNRGRPSPHALPEGLRGQVVALARGRYAGLTDVHLTEQLTAVEGLGVSRATVQRLLRGAGLRSPRRRAPRHRSRRPRRPQAGLLLRLDGSPFAWFGHRGPACSRLAALDDATGAVPAACFRAEEDPAGGVPGARVGPALDGKKECDVDCDLAQSPQSRTRPSSRCRHRPPWSKR